MERFVDPDRWRGLEDLPLRLRAKLRPFCRDESEYEDVVQEACLRAARYRPQLRSADRLDAWGLRIALNVLNDGRRRSSRAFGSSGGDGDETIQALPDPRGADEDAPEVLRMGRYEIDPGDAAELVGELIPRLRSDDRTILDEFYRAGFSPSTIAERRRISRQLVKVRLFRARQRLWRAVRHQLAVRHGKLPPEPGEGAEGDR